MKHIQYLHKEIIAKTNFTQNKFLKTTDVLKRMGGNFYIEMKRIITRTAYVHFVCEKRDDFETITVQRK